MLSGTPVVSWVVCVCAEVDRLIGQVAEIASACPESLAAVMGRRRRAAGTRTGRGRTFIARRSGRSRGAGTLRWTACFTARRRRTWATRSTAARWTTPPMTPALLPLGTPGFWVGSRARDFPTERVLSRTPLIIRTVDQKNKTKEHKRRQQNIHVTLQHHPTSSCLLPVSARV